MLDEEFFEEVSDTLFYGSLPDFQREPLAYIAEEFERRNMTSIDTLAYIYATAYWETDRFKATEEYGRGKGRDYGAPLLSIRGKYQSYYGRGWVQLTWLQNYGKMSVAASMALGRPVDLVNNPDLIMNDLEVNAFVTFEGMITGMFTGAAIGKYINSRGTDFVNSRRVINGTNKATEIAAIAVKFQTALNNVDKEAVNGRSKTRPFKFS